MTKEEMEKELDEIEAIQKEALNGDRGKRFAPLNKLANVSEALDDQKVFHGDILLDTYFRTRLLKVLAVQKTIK